MSRNTTSNDSISSYGRKINPKQRFIRHKFDKYIVKQVAQYLEGNNHNGILEVIEDWSIVFLTIIITIYLYNISHVIGVVAYMIALIIIGGRQRAIADILHQASHGAVAENKYLNWLLGTFFSGYTVLQSFSIYKASHVLLHHPFLGNPHKDPDYIGLISNNICGINRSHLTTKKYIYSIISPFSSYNYFKYLVNNRILDQNENKYETVVRLMYWSLVLYVIISNGHFITFMLFWLIPLISSNVWVGSLLELLEHFPMIDDPNIQYIDILLSKNRIWSTSINFVLGIHQEGYHLVHHLFPKLPSWNYIIVHNILMQDEIYAALDHGKNGCIDMIKQIIKNSGEFRVINSGHQNYQLYDLMEYVKNMIKLLINGLEKQLI